MASTQVSYENEISTPPGASGLDQVHKELQRARDIHTTVKEIFKGQSLLWDLPHWYYRGYSHLILLALLVSLMV